MRLFGLLIFIFFLGFLTNLHAQNGSAGQPFTSLGQAQNVATDGVYYFSLSGNSFSTYVLVGGWVQVAIDFGSGTGNLPQSTALNNTVRGILTPTALSTLGSATVTRVLTSNGQLDVQNTRPGIITRIVNNQTLLAVPGDNTDNGTNWTGTNTLATQFTNFGNTTAYGLHSNFFHAGNNGDGIHWIPFFNMQQIKNSAGDIPNGAYFQLLVRAPMVAVVMGPTINTQPSTTAQTLCLNSATTALSVSASSPNGSAITYQWYSNASNSTVGGTAIGGATSASYTPPNNVAGTKYYYVICTNNQGSTTTNVSAAITIQSPSVGGTASSNQTICGGTSPANLTLASNTGSIQWQSSTDNITFTNIAGATSSSLTSAQMGVLNATRYYRANVTNGVCASAISNTLTITVNPAPTLTSTTGASICGTGTATLQASTAAGTINWYAASTGGASLGTGTSYTTPSINTTTTYYADVTNNGCTSNPRTAVLATVSAAPNPTITQTGCGTLSIGNLTANALDLGANNNSSNYVTIPSTINSTMNTNNITLEGWFYFSATNAGLPMLIGEAYNVDANITYCIHRSGNQIIAGFYNGGWQAASSTTFIPINTWIHIASTYDQNQVKLYFNGVLNATFNSNQTLPVSNNQPWYLGKRWDYLETLSGAMDEIRIWNVARTQAQIQASMNTSVPTNSAGLRAYYKLDESSGNTAADATGNGYNGTLSNSPTWQVPSTSPLNTNGNGNTFTYLWSPGGQTTSSITPATSGTYSAVVTNAAGCQSASVSSSIIVGVTASSNQTICAGTSPANLTLSGSTTTVQWQSSTDNITFTNIAGATSTTLSAAQMGTLNSTRYYRASYTNGACAPSTSTTVTITVTSSPTLTSTSGASLCGTGTVTLQATAAAGNINWYAASTGGASLGTGTSYTTPSIASTTTYYVDVTNNGCTSNPRTAVVATINTLPLAVSNTSGAVDYLVVGGGGGGGFDGAGGGGGGQVKTGSTPLSSGTFAVTIGNGGANGTSYGTQGANGGTTTLSLPTPIVSIGGGGAGSKGANGATGANGGGGGHSNYAGAAGAVGGFAGGNANGDGGGGGGGAGTAGASGSAGRNGGDGVLSSISGSATYYGGGGGGGSYSGSGSGLGGLGGGGRGGLGNSPLATAGAANTGGGGGGAGEAQSNPGKYGGSGVVIVKYAGAQNGTGGVITSVGGYTIHTFNANGSFVFNGAASSAVVPHMSSCGASAITFTGTALGAGITLDWYDAANGGNLLSQGTTTYTTPVISTTTTYYVAARNTTTGCVSATRTAVIATIYAIPTISTATGASICASGTTTLQATTAAGTINWYAASTGGASLGTGTSFTTPNINTTTTYYADVTNNGCTSSPRTAVVATVNALPTLTSTTGASICGTGTATLQATAAAGTINWYAASTGGASLGTGTSYTTPSIATNTTYYAAVTNNGCTSNPRTAVVATVNAIPTPTITQSGCGVLTLGNYGGGNALDFGQFNNTSFVTIPSSLNSVFNTNNITLEGWFKFDVNSAGFPMLIGEAFSGDGKVTFCMHKHGNNINAGFYLNGWTVVTSASTIQYNTWMHIAATYDQTSIKIYINGNLDATLNTNAALPTGAESWYIGKRWDNNEVFRGVMDEIRVWNIARTQAQIQASMNTSVPTNSTGLRAYYKLDESAGTNTADATGNGYNGTLTNGSTWQVPSTSILGGAQNTILWSPGGQTTNVITATTSGTYTAVVTSASGCSSAPVSTSIIIGGVASSSQTVCPGLLPSPITLTNYNGTIQWQTSNDNVTFTNIAGQTTATLAANAIGIMAGTKYIRAMLTNGACVAPSNTITLSPASVNVLTALTANSYVWNGQSSNNWGTLSNWYSYNGTSLVPAAALPGSTANTIIPANTGCILTQPTLSSGAIIINSLILETGSQLTQSGGSLLLYTNFVKNGSLISTGGLMNFYGPTSATISGSGAVQFAKMRVNKLAGATLTLQIPVSVSDSLYMIAGNIYTTTNNLLTLGLNSATPGKLAYTNGTIVGPFKRFFANTAISGLAGRFPVGTATYNRYAEFSFSSSPGIDQALTVNYASGAPVSGGNVLYNGLPHWASGSLMQNYSADGYWNVIPTNNDYTSTINTVPYEVTLFANNLTGMQTPQVCRIIKSGGSNTAAQHHVAWQACGTHTAINGAANPQAFLISSTASQGFSWFNIGTPNSQALPVEFAGMTLECGDDKVLIQWSTESEHNNQFFKLEKSSSGLDWILLDQIPSVGNSTSTQWYSYSDITNHRSNYYRLSQIDLDGTEEWLSTLMDHCVVDQEDFNSYPNPSQSSFSILWRQFSTTGLGSISIRDLNGKIVLHKSVDLAVGDNIMMIHDVTTPGVYLIELADDAGNKTILKHIVK